MGENEVQEIKERLVRIESILENMADTNDLKLVNYDEKLKVANHRIEDLENANRWMWRTIAGAIIAGVIAFLFK